jgi:serine/threonine-protein kinase
MLAAIEPGDLYAGRFELESRVRSGGAGALWRARDREGGAEVALKLARGREGDDAAWLEREAIAAGISHPGIARRVGHGVAPGGVRYVATEWIEGVDLGSRLARGSLSIDESLALAERAAEALAAAHARGLVHGGLTPAELFLPGGEPGRVMLLDLGTARAPRVSPVGAAGLAAGAPAYLAPEQVQGESVKDPRADVFSLGCVLYECLVGRPAFGGTFALAALAKVLLSSPPSVRRLREEVPAPIDGLVGRMLSKSPEARPSGFAEVIGILRDVSRRRTAGADHAHLEAPGGDLDRERTEAELLGTVPPAASKHVWLLVALTPGRPEEGEAIAPLPARVSELAELYNASLHRLFDGSLVCRLDPERTAASSQDPPSAPGESLLELRRNAVLLNRLRRARIQALGGERAARCALGVRASMKGAPMVLTMTPRSRQGEWISAQSIEWAMKLLDGGLRAGLQGIVMDKESADLLRVELFNVVGTGDLVELRGEWANPGV